MKKMLGYKDWEYIPSKHGKNDTWWKVWLAKDGWAWAGGIVSGTPILIKLITLLF